MSGSKVKQENSLRTKGRSKANKCGDPKQEEIKKKLENQDVVGLETKSKVEVEQMCIYNCYYLYIIIIKFEHGEILYVQLVGVQFQISFFFSFFQLIFY